MTDKEKIELIIQEKHLNNTQFCNEVCIAPGTLSHILSGRTQPTLNILRSITQAFPDINPAWLFFNAEPIYLNPDSPTPSEGVAEDDAHNNTNVEEAANFDDGQLSLFTMSSNPAPAAASSAPTSRRASATSAVAPAVNVQEIVAETLKQQQKPPRKVVEVRIFFDDGTFETFSAS